MLRGLARRRRIVDHVGDILVERIDVHVGLAVLTTIPIHEQRDDFDIALPHHLGGATESVTILTTTSPFSEAPEGIRVARDGVSRRCGRDGAFLLSYTMCTLENARRGEVHATVEPKVG